MRRGTPASEGLGAALWELRLQKGLPMAEVARRFGVARAVIYHIEHGQRALKKDKISAYASALGIKETALQKLWEQFESLGEPPIVRRSRRAAPKSELEEAINGLTAVDRQRVLGYVEGLVAKKK